MTQRSLLVAAAISSLALLDPQSASAGSEPTEHPLAEQLREIWKQGEPREPREITIIPVLAREGLTLDSEYLNVCMNDGVPPKSYRLVSYSCGEGEDHCTVFVSMPRLDGEILLVGYDVSNPPVVVQGTETCTAPYDPPSGVLSRDRPLGGNNLQEQR